MTSFIGMYAATCAGVGSLLSRGVNPEFDLMVQVISNLMCKRVLGQYSGVVLVARFDHLDNDELR